MHTQEKKKKIPEKVIKVMLWLIEKEVVGWLKACTINLKQQWAKQEFIKEQNQLIWNTSWPEGIANMWLSNNSSVNSLPSIPYVVFIQENTMYFMYQLLQSNNVHDTHRFNSFIASVLIIILSWVMDSGNSKLAPVSPIEYRPRLYC